MKALGHGDLAFLWKIEIAWCVKDYEKYFSIRAGTVLYLRIYPFINLVLSFIMLKALLGKNDCTFKLAITTSKTSVLETGHDYIAWSRWILIRMRSVLYHVILIIYCHAKVQMNYRMFYENLCRSVTEDLNFSQSESTELTYIQILPHAFKSPNIYMPLLLNSTRSII